MKLFIWLLSTPYVFASFMTGLWSPNKILVDLNECLAVVEKYGACVPRNFIDALIVGEDHRNELHPGVDVIAIIRALYIKIKLGHVQGASTIEQQYVRIISNRFERTVSRKIREQVLAVMLTRRARKREIASAYLSVAFYGAGSIGIGGLKAQFGDDLSRVSFHQALRMIAQLKYPRPRQFCDKWHAKIEVRCALLLNRTKFRDGN